MSFEQQQKRSAHSKVASYTESSQNNLRISNEVSRATSIVTVYSTLAPRRSGASLKLQTMASRESPERRAVNTLLGLISSDDVLEIRRPFKTSRLLSVILHGTREPSGELLIEDTAMNNRTMSQVVEKFRRKLEDGLFRSDFNLCRARGF